MLLKQAYHKLRDDGQADQQVIQDLEEENQRLRKMIAAHGEGSMPGNSAMWSVAKSGYLNKYRPRATSSLWANTWEPRYVIVRSGSLMYYKNERDVYRYPPRGQLSLRGTFVDVEGLKRRKYWTFRVMDGLGVDLVRLSTESHSEMTAWLDALEDSGCSRKQYGEKQASADSEADDVVSGSLRRSAVHGSEGDFQRIQSGYTSDQSDMGTTVTSRAQRSKGGQTSKQKDTKMKGLGTGYDGCVPVHMHPKFSLLSSERIRVSDQSGMVTLMFIILAAANFRLILENMIKYGIRFNPFTFIRAIVTPSGNISLLLCWPALGMFAGIGLVIEQLAAAMLRRDLMKRMGEEKKEVMSSDEISKRFNKRRKFAEGVTFLLNLINTSLVLLVPFHIITVTMAEPLPSFGLTMMTTVLWFKLVSFIHVNWSLRQLKCIDPRRRWPGESLSGSEPLAVETDDMVYPANLSLTQFSYFLVAPTLCYQLSYPRSPRFRVRWLMRRIVMLSAGLGMMLFFFEQYIEPTIDNSMKPLQEMDWLVVIERVLKLSIPTLYFWLAMFYSLFELWLNVLAEITRFGDREFYKEWWNATTLGEYWRLWNMPVHKWMLRHVCPVAHASWLGLLGADVAGASDVGHRAIEAPLSE
ncbi:hypothetical protein M9435_005100 [Picochlorum sp. BPE23]|nr:hypothetical protein M9435_005100 [Picochlorum sp. BPE23]